ncbi:fasciclin domain-containing protein [Pseudoflavitalea sp. G-6-1-2]|uniref:fasciclin domain-containing protein n=1 Tax=Pseudoflavitalea sp. G-6-1-2 TaxID=2728841 RepID=UPI00146BB785|nr:fasciclin domain-containing protein [Pseudoflavitalea sp. G-6-1-2]NML23833.1 fasciclin domain-containing protein [Pseudoflavitalea sp. G-6-1-2]
MMKNLRLFIPLILAAIIFATGCSKLQDGYNYKKSFYETELNMSVMDFMNSRKDMFSGMLAAIEYVDKDPKHKDVKAMYSTQGNTFLLMHNNALTNLDDAASWWTLNRVWGDDPLNPGGPKVKQKGTDWSQYTTDSVASLLRYHVLKGEQTYKTLNSTGRWVETFETSKENDSAKIFLFLENVREANLRINAYTNPGPPVEYGGLPVKWDNIAPRTPDLHATNGIVHVVNRWFLQPTREAIRNN